jgi:hypothetical protein
MVQSLGFGRRGWVSMSDLSWLSTNLITGFFIWFLLTKVREFRRLRSARLNFSASRLWTLSFKISISVFKLSLSDFNLSFSDLKISFSDLKVSFSDLKLEFTKDSSSSSFTRSSSFIFFLALEFLQDSTARFRFLSCFQCFRPFFLRYWRSGKIS